MSWTIDYSDPRHPELLDAFLLALGKALCLANNFEAKCAHYLQVIAVTDALREGKSHEEACKLGRKAYDQNLATALRGIHASGDISDSDFELLQRARESRNYIAHQGTDIGELHGASDQRILRNLASLYPHVVNVAKGENLASRWAFEVCEREPAPRAFVEGYVEMATTWVFGEAFSVELSQRGEL